MGCYTYKHLRITEVIKDYVSRVFRKNTSLPKLDDNPWMHCSIRQIPAVATHADPKVKNHERLAKASTIYLAYSVGSKSSPRIADIPPTRFAHLRKCMWFRDCTIAFTELKQTLLASVLRHRLNVK